MEFTVSEWLEIGQFAMTWLLVPTWYLLNRLKKKLDAWEAFMLKHAMTGVEVARTTADVASQGKQLDQMTERIDRIQERRMQSERRVDDEHIGRDGVDRRVRLDDRRKGE